MNKHLPLMLVTAIGITFAGCSAATKELTHMSQSVKTDVFTEVNTAEAPTSGFADMVIKTSIKTPPRSNKPYSFLFNIDGQAVVWNVDGQRETVPLYDASGKTSRDPDAGEGVKYHLEKKIRLAPGKHSIFFALPEEPYYTVVRITLTEAETSILEFKPRYRYKTVPTRIPTFLAGISNYEALLNGTVLQGNE